MKKQIILTRLQY